MRAIASPLAAVCVLLAAELVAHAAPPETTVAIYWQPPGNPPLSGAARAAFADAVRPTGARFVEVSPPELRPPSLAPALESAKASYARFAFRDAVTALDGLQRAADAAGGGDLDGRQLSEIFLYRGLAKVEIASAEAAWDDLVNAARLEPTRVLDPLRFPPRAAAAYKRAAAEVAQLPRAELVFDVPADAVVRVDGARSAHASGVTMGLHFVSVAADGYERWTSAITVSSTPTRFKPPLHLHRPPPIDRLLALAGTPEPQRLLVGALEQGPGGWTFTIRDIALPSGRVVSDTVALGSVPTRAAVMGLMGRLHPSEAPSRRRLMPWIVGAAAAALMTATIAIAASRDPSPNVMGELGSWR